MIFLKLYTRDDTDNIKFLEDKSNIVSIILSGQFMLILKISMFILVISIN